MLIAIDTEITEELSWEGYAREFIKIVQNYRKENKFNVTDKIEIVCFSDDESITKAIRQFEDFICRELLCDKLIFERQRQQQESIIEDKKIYLHITIL
jgi:isoleucyl-tRNA synthetase